MEITWKLNYCRPQRSWGKVMFLQVCVILFTGGEYLTPPRGQVHTPQDQVSHLPPDQVHPPPRARYPTETMYTPLDQVQCPGPGTPPWTRYIPRTRYPPGPGTPPGTWHPPRPGTSPDQVHPPPRGMLRDTVNTRAVRILLECNLV